MASSSPPMSGTPPPVIPGVLVPVLLPSEFWWRDHYHWLDEIGYALRPRYKPNWVPPWIAARRSPYDFESCLILAWGHVIDAVRKSDGAHVTLKRIKKSVHPYEADIARFLSSPPLASDPRNHCCPMHDIIPAPDDDDVVILVMPLLRTYRDPAFATIGEFMECFRQIFEGLQFMHSHHVAHRDIMTLNILMDAIPMFPEMYHPQLPFRRYDYAADVHPYTRTERPTKYYLVDFGLSRRYSPEDTDPLEYPIFGGDRSVPEFLKDPEKPRNPFQTDIYYLGSLIRDDILRKYSNCGFLEPLVQSMVADDPAARPTIDEAFERFTKLLKSLPWWKLRSRPVRREDSLLTNVAKGIWHVYKTTKFVVHLRKPVPTPPS